MRKIKKVKKTDLKEREKRGGREKERERDEEREREREREDSDGPSHNIGHREVVSYTEPETSSKCLTT